MIIKNAYYPNKDFDFVNSDIAIENGLITGFGRFSGEDCFDAAGHIVLPGFIDIHIHGAALADCSSGEPGDIMKISEYLLAHGVTSFCPTTMTLPYDKIENALRAIRRCMGNESGASIIGAHLEGPFISETKKGAQASEYIRKPDFEALKRFDSICPVSIVVAAPEIDGAEDFAKKADDICTVSAAHTNADYDTAKGAYKNGFSHATHLFNAMSPIKNREPGVPVAVFESGNVTAELICDGIHNHPAIVRLAFGQLGEDRVCVISDSMSAAGCGDGEYSLGGQKVFVKNGKATLADGTIAGSTTNLYDEFLNLLRFGIPLRAAVKACTINPAKAVRADKETGSIEAGKRADLLIINDKYEIVRVIKGGK